VAGRAAPGGNLHRAEISPGVRSARSTIVPSSTSITTAAPARGAPAGVTANTHSASSCSASAGATVRPAARWTCTVGGTPRSRGRSRWYAKRVPGGAITCTRASPLQSAWTGPNEAPPIVTRTDACGAERAVATPRPESGIAVKPQRSPETAATIATCGYASRGGRYSASYLPGPTARTFSIRPVLVVTCGAASPSASISMTARSPVPSTSEAGRARSAIPAAPARAPGMAARRRTAAARAAVTARPVIRSPSGPRSPTGRGPGRRRRRGAPRRAPPRRGSTAWRSPPPRGRAARAP